MTVFSQASAMTRCGHGACRACRSVRSTKARHCEVITRVAAPLRNKVRRAEVARRQRRGYIHCSRCTAVVHFQRHCVGRQERVQIKRNNEMQQESGGRVRVPSNTRQARF